MVGKTYRWQDIKHRNKTPGQIAELATRVQQMVEVEELTNIAPEQLKNLVDFRDSREEVLRSLSQQKARQEIVKKMLEIGEPPEKVASITKLSLEELQNLQ